MPNSLNRRGGGTVLLVNHHAMEPGGAENYLLYLAEGLSGLGLRVAITWNRDREVPAWPAGESAVEVDWVRCAYHGERDIRKRLLLSLYHPGARKDMARLCGEIGPDIVHVNQSYEGDGIDLIRAACEFGKVPVFGTIHLRSDPPTANRLLAPGKRALLRPFFRRFPYTKVFPSARQMSGFADVYGDDGLLRVVPNGIRLPALLADGEAAEKKRVLGLAGRTVLTYAGRVTREKGADIMVEAFLEARRAFPDLYLVVMGDGPARPEMERRLGHLAGSDGWMTTGWTSRIREYLCATDLLLLPSRFEAMPLSILEALCLGIPCLCTPYEGIEDLTSLGARVELSERIDAASFTEGLVRTLSSLDSCRKLAIANVETVRRTFDCRRMADDILRLYRGAE